MPKIVVLAGINGAGKTTASRWVLDSLRVPVFVNADAIARGLNGLNPESEAVRAGRVMLDWIHDLAADHRDFAIETTLAARTYAAWLGGLRDAGYEVYLFYYWLSSAELAITRVAERVAAGGHHIPDATVRQRYGRSVRNLFELYRPVCTGWRVYDNSEKLARLIAFGTPDQETVLDGYTWVDVLRSAGHDRNDC
jgi:predicted ABC-type ATPase